MYLYPPSLRIHYREDLCEEFRKGLRQLEDEAYKPFISAIEKMKNVPVYIQLKDQEIHGKITDINSTYLMVLDNNQQRMKINLKNILMLHFS